MKIVITVQSGSDLEAPLDPRFGRCGSFLVLDSEEKEPRSLEFIANREREAAHGAGVGAAAVVASTGAEVVISSHVTGSPLTNNSSGRLDFCANVRRSISAGVKAAFS